MTRCGILWRISAPHFCAGVIVAQDGIVLDAAPILRWACNKPWAYLRQWALRRRYCVERVEP